MKKAQLDHGAAIIKSARRVLDILEYLKATRHPICTTDLATTLDWPISSTASLLKSLVSLGYLVFDRTSRTYRASVRVGLLGGWSYDDELDTVQISRLIEQLAAASGLSVYLATRNDIYCQCVQVVARCANAEAVVGSKRYLSESTLGLTLLAAEDDQSAERILRRINAEQDTARPRVDTALTMGRVRAIRARGYAFEPGNNSGDPSWMAKLVRPSNLQLLVLGMVGSRQEMMPRQPLLANLLDDTIRAIGLESKGRMLRTA
jgi:DNA-binding IclR family transcriptional regulator